MLLQELEDLLCSVDELHEQKDYQTIFEMINSYVKENPDADSHVEVLWRFARAHYDLSGEVGVTKNKQEQLLRAGQQLAVRCYELESENYFSQKWMAVFISALTEFDSIKNKIQSAFTIKEHCDRANELLGIDEKGEKIKDGTLEHLLGRWCFRIASITWIERKLAKAIIAELPASPEEATYENALTHFLVADELKENFVVNALWCGHAYKKLGNMKKAKQWYQKAFRMKQESFSDKQSAKEARKLLSKL